MATQITTELVKELRDKTGVSVMQCKNALIEAEGDMEKALLILKKTSSDIALKKGAREAKDGRVAIQNDGTKAVMVVLNCETDFVAKNEDFVKLLQELTDIAFKEGVQKMQSVAKDMIDPVIQKTGENIQLGEAYQVEGNLIGSYIHNDKSGVIVCLDGGTPDLARDIAMHVTAMKPEYISGEEISDEVRKSVSEIFEKEVAQIDKPEEIKKKMLEGKINTYFKEKTLPEQPFIKNPDETIGELLKRNNATIKEVKFFSI